MPTISSSLVQPLVTPSTALLTSARTSPCTAEGASSARTPPSDGVVAPPGDQSMHRGMGGGRANRHQGALLLLHRDAGRKGCIQLAFRPLDHHRIAFDLDRHALRGRDRLFSNS